MSNDIDIDIDNRKTCLDCVEKHLSVSYILLQESLQGYPEHEILADKHLEDSNLDSLTSASIETKIKAVQEELKKTGEYSRWKIIGNLSEAADECIISHPELAKILRDERLKYSMLQDYEIDFKTLKDLLCILQEKKQQQS